jgi:hypothetical protein
MTMAIKRPAPAVAEAPPLKTTERQREAQKVYAAKQTEKGYYQTRPWLPVEFTEWHALFVRRAREWKEYGVPFQMPDLPHLPIRSRD